MRQYRSAATTRGRAAPCIKSAAFSVIISTQALMWAETRDRAWPRHRRRAVPRHPARAIQDRAARPRPIPSGWCPPDDARSGNAAGDRRGRASVVQRARLFCDQSGRCRRLGPGSARDRLCRVGWQARLLRTLAEAATTDPAIEATIGSIEKLDDPPAILHLVAATVRSMREQFGDGPARDAA